MIAIRPHHALCAQFYEGKGYDQRFVEHMSDTLLSFAEQDPLVTLTSACDHLCAACPHNEGDVCATDGKVRAIDERTIAALGLSFGDSLRWSELIERARSSIVERGLLPSVCRDCEWINICEQSSRATTAPLLLIKFGAKDKPLYDRLVFDQRVMNANYGRVFTEREADELFAFVLAQNAEQTLFGFYKVYAMRGGMPVYIGLGAILSDEDDSAELEYMLLPAYWHQGYGAKLAAKLVESASSSPRVKRLVAITDPANVYSRRILTSLGFSMSKQGVNAEGERIETYQKTIEERV